MKLTSYLALVSSFFTSAHALVGTSWSMTNVPSSGLPDITFPITIFWSYPIAGYYFAQQFNFVGHDDVGYTGLQPRPNDGSGQPVLRGVFSSFIAGTTTTDPNCHDGADGGPGVSCGVIWNGPFNREYHFEVKSVGNRQWVGTVIDTVTQQRIHIGSWTLPAGTAGIQYRQAGFVEWYPWNSYKPPNHCSLLPVQMTKFGTPRTTHPGSVGTQHLAYQYGDCVGQIPFDTQGLPDGMFNSCGFTLNPPPTSLTSTALNDDQSAFLYQ